MARKNKKGVKLPWLSVFTPKKLLTPSLDLITKNEVLASQTQLVLTSPQAFHRACPALGLSTEYSYNISRRRAIAYITALKDRVLHNFRIKVKYRRKVSKTNWYILIVKS